MIRTSIQALLKAFKGVGMEIPKKDSNILLTVKDADKPGDLAHCQKYGGLGDASVLHLRDL